jgi:hypothetical protein
MYKPLWGTMLVAETPDYVYDSGVRITTSIHMPQKGSQVYRPLTICISLVIYNEYNRVICHIVS